MRFIASFFASIAFLTLAGCDTTVAVDFLDDGRVSVEVASLLDSEACEIADRQVPKGQKVCGGTNPDGKPITKVDPSSGKHRILAVDGKQSREFASIDEFATKSSDISLEHDADAQIVTVRLPREAFQNVSRGPASLEKSPTADEQTIKALGGIGPFEGNAAVFVVSAAEILESNGVISADRKQVEFHIPAEFFALGVGPAPYDELYVKARY